MALLNEKALANNAYVKISNKMIVSSLIKWNMSLLIIAGMAFINEGNALFDYECSSGSVV